VRPVLGLATLAALAGEPLIEEGERRVGLGVEDGVHVLDPADEAEDSHGLVGSDHQLDARPLRRGEPCPEMRVTGTARPVDGVIAGIVDATDETEPLGETATPLQRRLTTAAVVEDREPRVVVAAAEHRRAVVLDRVETHHPEPGHEPSCATNPEGCNRVCAVGVMDPVIGRRRGVRRDRSMAVRDGARVS
jgi:hypothetical protein